MSRRRFRRRHIRHILLLSFGCALFFVGIFVLWAATLRIPDLAGFEERKVAQSTKIYDRTGEILLYDIHKNAQRTVVPFDKISRNIKNATVAIEDAEFYEHRGVKPSAVFRAILSNILEGRVYGQGGSTITQQVVKNALLTQEKRIARKLKEWVLAAKLEQIFTKEEILALYLNEAPYGGSLYGIEEASQTFFGKSASFVSVAEAAYLAALPQAPTYYSPYGNNREALEARKGLVLEKMLENGFLTTDEFAEARDDVVVFLPRADTGILAPHFVQYVREYLEQTYGERTVEERGFRVTTTLDYDLQRAAEEIVLRHALSNEERFNAENAALSAVDPKTGEILVMVGSRDYFDKNIDGNFNVTVARRQPGSAFKPFVYATALKKGYTLDTVVYDMETEFSTECTPIGEPLYPSATCYMPGNYDNVFRGPVSFRNALAQSINVPAVKVLYLAGLADSLKTARDMGIRGLADPSRYGLTLVLGGGEVSPLEMASAYGVFAAQGVRHDPVAVLNIEDVDGNIVESFAPTPRTVLDEEIALQITDALADNEARAPAFGDSSYLHIPGFDVAVKTGTTNDYRDVWIIGYTPNIAVAAWAGNNDNTSMEKRVAGFIVAPMWNEFMVRAITKRPIESFPAPQNTVDTTGAPVLRGLWQGGASYMTDRVSGKLATDFTPPETRVEKVVPDYHSILHWVDHENPRGPSPERPELDPQYERWEYGVQRYVASHGLVPVSQASVPTEYDDVHTRENAPDLDIRGISPSGIHTPNDLLMLAVSTSGPYPLQRVEFYLNDTFIGSDTSTPFTFAVAFDDYQDLRPVNTLRVAGTDTVFNRSEKIVSVTMGL